MLQTLALFATATLFGGMVLYSFGFAPLVFSKLPAKQAATLLRDAFPFYYLFVIALAIAGCVAALANDALAAWLLGIVAVLGVAARQLLMPAINRARDAQVGGDAKAKGRFARLHGLSVAVNFVQLGAIAVALHRLAFGTGAP